MSDKQNTGFYFKEPSGKTPDFIKSKVGVNVKQAIEWLTANQNESGYVNLDLKLSQNGNYYFAVNNWKPEGNDAP